MRRWSNAPRHLESHGPGITAEYRIWSNIKQRCGNPKTPAYANYGARGITICDEWRDSYEAFLGDMGRRPTPRHTIDRIDNDGNYEPGNVRWSEREEQNRNRRNNVMIDAFGETMCLSAWSQRSGVDRKTLAYRIRTGVPPEAAMSPTYEDPTALMLNAFGKRQRLSAWAREYGFTVGALQRRVAAGWDIEKALTTPLRVSSRIYPKKAA